MNLSQMEYFLEVADKLNFTMASRSLYISQPALSKQIALLEEELGTRLFIRSSRRVMLTIAGKQFEEDLKAIRLQIELAKKHAIEIGKAEKPIFRLGCFNGVVMEDFLPSVYKHIQKMAPDVQISLFRHGFQENRKALEDGMIDVLLTLNVDYIYDEHYQMRALIKRKGALIYSTKSPLAGEKNINIANFEEEPYLVLQQKLSQGIYQSTIKYLNKVGIKNPRITEMESFSTLCAYLEMGYGYALLTGGIIEKNPELRKFVLDEEVDFYVDVVAVWKKENTFAEILMGNFSMI